MSPLLRKTLFPISLFLLAGWANATVLSSDARSLTHLTACADGAGGLWLLVGESADYREDLLSVSVWHASSVGEPGRIGEVPLPEDGGRDAVDTFANCRNSAGGGTAHVQVGSALNELRLTRESVTLHRRINLEPLQKRGAGYDRLLYVGTVKGALLIATPSIWLEGEQGFDLVKRDPGVPWVAGLSFSSTGEHLYYVETITPPNEFAPRVGLEAVRAHQVRLVQETFSESGWERTGQSAPLDIPGWGSAPKGSYPPMHLAMVESGRFHVLSYYWGGDHLVLHSGSGTSTWRSGDAAGLVRLNLDRRRVVEDVDIWPSPLVYWTKLARSLYFAHVVEHADRMQPWTLRVVRVDADGETERLDVPLPPDIRSSSGISPAGMTDIIASGNRLYAISTVRGRFDDGELRRRDVVAIDRLR